MTTASANIHVTRHQRSYVVGREFVSVVFLSLAVVAVCIWSIIRSDDLMQDSVAFQIRASEAYATAGSVTGINSRGKLAQSRALESARQATITLTVSIAVVTLISIGGFLYLNLKLVRTRRDLEGKNRELHEIKGATERIIDSAAHELYTPLATTTAFTDVIARNREGNLSERQIKQLEVVQRNNRRLSAMVENMVQNASAGELTDPGIKTVRFSSFIADTLEEIQRDVELQGVSIQSSMLESDARVTIDGNRIHQVISNLLVNAIQNSPTSAIVFVSTELIDGNVLTSIRDFGPGIPIEDQAHVFSPFYRVDTEGNRRNRAAGLGLTLVKRVVEAHGGIVGLESVEGDNGATFFFTLPVDDRD